MKPKLILCLAFLLSGVLFGCAARQISPSPNTNATVAPQVIPIHSYHVPLTNIQLIPASASSNTVAYSIKNLGTLGGNSSAATAINASGQVVGEAMTAAGEQHAFLYSGDKMQDLGTLPGFAFSRATGVNASGQIVGWVGTSAVEQRRAFIYSEGRMWEIGSLGGKTSEAHAINAAGDIVGEAETATGQRHAFLYTGGRMRDLGTLGAAYGLNDAGQVIGISGVTVGRRVPFIYDSDKMVLLDTSEPIQINPSEPSTPRLGPGRMNQISQATAINSAGQIVGYMGDITQWSSDHAFLYSDGKLQDLGTLGGNAPFSQAEAINARGQIVGMSGSHPLDNNSMDGERAFLYSERQMKDLRQLVGEATLAASGFKALLVADGINDRGQIVGTGIDLKRNETAFLLTPIRQE